MSSSEPTIKHRQVIRYMQYLICTECGTETSYETRDDQSGVDQARQAAHSASPPPITCKAYRAKKKKAKP